MRCKKCGKKIAFRWALRYLFSNHPRDKRYCMDCITVEFLKYQDNVIFLGTSCLDVEGLYNGYCPLFNDSTCILDEEYSSCPYKDGWRSCYYYIKNGGKYE